MISVELTPQMFLPRMASSMRGSLTGRTKKETPLTVRPWRGNGAYAERLQTNSTGKQASQREAWNSTQNSQLYVSLWTTRDILTWDKLWERLSQSSKSVNGTFSGASLSLVLQVVFRRPFGPYNVSVMKTQATSLCQLDLFRSWLIFIVHDVMYCFSSQCQT